VGVSLRRDREGSRAFLGSDLWASVEQDDSVKDATSHDHEVIDEPTKSTQPALQVL